MTRRYARRDGEKRMNKQQLLVVGNGMVGHHFIEQLVNAGGLDTFAVTVLEKAIARSQKECM